MKTKSKREMPPWEKANHERFWADPLNRPWPKMELRIALALLEKYGLVRRGNGDSLRHQITAGGCRCDDIPFGDGLPWCPVHDDGRMGEPPPEVKQMRAAELEAGDI